MSMPRVLLIYRVMIASVRLCGHSQMEAMAAMGLIEYRARMVKRIARQDIEWADAVVLGRLDGRSEHYLAQLLKRAGKRLIYILDDDLLHVPAGIQSMPYYAQERVKRSIRGMLAMSDAILSPSPLLLDKYATDGQRRLLTEEPAVNAVPYVPHDPDAPVRIGFAGSVDRAGDVADILSGALRQIKREYGARVEIGFFGIDIPLARELNARVTPFTNSYDDYREALNRCAWDIGLAPMPDSSFYACKHYNKFTEYAAAGVVGIYSDLEPYARLKRTMGLGLFCENRTEAWVAAIRELVDDREKREALRRQVCECAAGPLNIETIARKLYADMDGLLSPADETGKIACLMLFKAYNLAERVELAVKGYGWGVFRVLIRKMLGRA